MSINDSEYRLWICGAGEAEKEVAASALKDPRIQYFGQLPREKVLELQRKATVLINPRGKQGEFTKYSFPSKIMEYLLAGRPVVACDLPGMPGEYKEYIRCFDKNTPQQISEALLFVCSQNSDQLDSIGKKGQAFVLRDKNNIVQTRRILDMISGCL